MTASVMPLSALFDAVDALADRVIAQAARCGDARQRAIRSPAAVWAAIHAHAEARARAAKQLAATE